MTGKHRKDDSIGRPPRDYPLSEKQGNKDPDKRGLRKHIEDQEKLNKQDKGS